MSWQDIVGTIFVLGFFVLMLFVLMDYFQMQAQRDEVADILCKEKGFDKGSYNELFWPEITCIYNKEICAGEKCFTNEIRKHFDPDEEIEFLQDGAKQK